MWNKKHLSYLIVILFLLFLEAIHLINGQVWMLASIGVIVLGFAVEFLIPKK